MFSHFLEEESTSAVSMPGVSMLPTAESSPRKIIADICNCIRQDAGPYRFGSFTASIYDTAWLSMVRKPEDDRVTWLFPESLEYILQSQRDDGTWESYASPVDGILNTLAALLAFLHHRDYEPNDPANLSRRIEMACKGLASLLQDWSVDTTVHVGFEILVPSLLRQVGRFGLHFDFPGRNQLYELQSRKMKRFKPELAYMKQPTTLLHSLEALVGLIDFDRVAHQCNARTGIFGSPAATAAYLMSCSTWDVRAEQYLKTTVADTGNHGGVPSAFPTSLFEFSWVGSRICIEAFTF
jgi:hypothetical protein